MKYSPPLVSQSAHMLVGPSLQSPWFQPQTCAPISFSLLVSQHSWLLLPVLSDVLQARCLLRLLFLVMLHLVTHLFVKITTSHPLLVLSIKVAGLKDRGAAEPCLVLIYVISKGYHGLGMSSDQSHQRLTSLEDPLSGGLSFSSRRLVWVEDS